MTAVIDPGMKRRAIEVLAGGIFLLIIIPILLYIGIGLPGQRPSTVTINNSRITVTIADSDAERAKGLSGSPQLKDGSGMLFIFDEPGYPGIWMKDMKYPIDIIWLDENRTIVHIQEFATPDSYPRVFMPQVPAKYVLEVPVGTVKSYGMNNGKTMTFNL